MKNPALMIAALALCGCAMDTVDGASAALAGDDALLALVNDQVETDLHRLDIDCAIRSDSARQIIRHRDGRDRTPLTADDDLFDTVEELDDVPMVGPWTLDRLRECAERFGYARGEWTTVLEEPEWAASQAAVAAFDDGTAAVLSRGIDSTPSGNRVVSRLRTFDGASWSPPSRLDEGMPSYASSYGTEVDMVFDHHLVALDDGRLVAGVGGRYSGGVLNAEGQLYTVFVRVRDASGWGAWLRATPVGRVFNAAMAADATGRVWIAYDSAYNLEAGEVHLTWFDPSTGATGTPEVIAASPATSAFQKLDVTVVGGDVWVTYWGADGLYARARQADGSLGAALRVSDHAAHAAASADGALFIVASARPRTTVFRVAGGAVVEDVVLFEDREHEDAEQLESTMYAYPAIAARPEGGVAVGVARIYHFERWVEPVSEADRTDLVVRERDSSGAWTAELAVHTGAAWDNAGGAMTSTGNSLWAAGASWDGVFAVRRTSP